MDTQIWHGIFRKTTRNSKFEPTQFLLKQTIEYLDIIIISKNISKFHIGKEVCLSLSFIFVTETY